MNNYFFLESSPYIDYGINKAPKLGAQSVYQGHFIDGDKLPPLDYEHDFPKGESMPHFLEDSSVLVSETFLKLLKMSEIDNFQVFPVTLSNPETGEIRNDYYLFNVVGLLKVASLDDMFRLADNPGNLIVSQKLIEALKDKKPAEGWGVTVEEFEVK